jgi:hypothetical protein
MSEELTVFARSCTLPVTQQPARAGEFQQLFADSVRRVHRPTPNRLRLDLDPTDEDVARDLTAREGQCCSFFTFTFSATDHELYVDIEVPPGYTDVLDELARRAASTERTDQEPGWADRR